LDVHITTCFLKYRNDGKKFTAALWTEKPYEPRKTAGIAKTAPVGFAGKYARGGLAQGVWEVFPYSLRTSLGTSRWKRQSPI
jgi:hypothetical protein